MSPAYEILSPSFRDMNIEQQIEAGINDWQADGAGGRVFFGQTREAAEAARAAYAATTSDFVEAHHGSIVVLTPLTEAGSQWMADHLPDDAQTWGRGVAIEARYWPAIESGIEDAGLLSR